NRHVFQMNNLDINVSIVMPSYNAEKYIKDAINSVLQQSYNAWELLIVDDNSSDRSVEIVKEIALKDCRIKLFEQNTNLGAATARNKAIEILSSGGWR
ncbi:MAG: glycosyltransferase family 2 protein, partial [Gammaproteobacteria bacterium]